MCPGTRHYGPSAAAAVRAGAPIRGKFTFNDRPDRAGRHVKI